MMSHHVTVFIFDNENTLPGGVNASSACSTNHLTVLAGFQVGESDMGRADYHSDNISKQLHQSMTSSNDCDFMNEDDYLRAGRFTPAASVEVHMREQRVPA